MLRRGVAASLTVALAFAISALASDVAEGSPFGKTTEQDAHQLLALAKSHGVDVEASYKKAEAGDAEALGQIFGIAERLTKMDGPARAYGNLLFSCFLNLVEKRGEEFFANALARQSQDVKQRVRDFIYYAAKQTPVAHRAEVERETRADFPKIFPATYVFGFHNRLF